MRARYRDASVSLSLSLEAILAAVVQGSHEALDTLLDYVSRLPAGKAPVTFGYTSKKNASMHFIIASQRPPKDFFALQHIVKNIYRFPNIIAVREGRSVHHTSAFANATCNTLVY